MKAIMQTYRSTMLQTLDQAYKLKGRRNIMTTIYTIGCPEVENQVATFATWGGGEGRWMWTVQDAGAWRTLHKSLIEEGYTLIRDGNHWTVRRPA